MVTAIVREKRLHDLSAQCRGRTDASRLPIAPAKPPCAILRDRIVAARGFPNFSLRFRTFAPAAELREVIAAVLRARVRQRMILWGLSGQVLRAGLGPLLADLVFHGFVGGIAMDGATLVHDFETAVIGKAVRRWRGRGAGVGRRIRGDWLADQ